MIFIYHSFVSVVFFGGRVLHVFSLVMVSTFRFGAVMVLVFGFGGFNFLT